MKKTALIVDDISASLYMLKIILEGEGLEVITAENGKDALDKAHAQPPDLIVSDILMPVMDGYALCRACKSDNTLKHIPFVFYTATYTEAKDERFALDLGADRFVLKPQEPEVLINILMDLLEEAQAVKRAATKPLGKEMEFLRQHNEVLFRKLEKKMTDLETANQELKALDERYRLNFENIADVIFAIDTDLNVLSMSPSVEKMLGYKPEDFIGRPGTDLRNIFTPESFEQAITDTRMVLKGETIPATLYRFIAKDGTLKYVEVNGSPIVRDGKIIGVNCIARDIAKRKQAEDALKESEGKYRELVKYAPAGIYEVDYETGRFTSVNDVICEYTGYTRDELLDTNLFNFLTEESQKLMGERLEKLFAGEKLSQTVEYSFITKSGEELWALLNAQYIYDEGKLKGATGVIYNITERKQADEALRASEKKYKFITEKMTDIIWMTDMELQTVYVTPSIETQLGFSQEERMRQSANEQLTPGSLSIGLEMMARELALEKQGHGDSERSVTLVLEYYHKDGSTRWLETIISGIRDDQGVLTGLYGVSRDVTRRKHAEESLSKSEQKFASTFHLNPNPMAISDTAIWKIIDVNQAFTRWTGYSREEVIGISTQDLRLLVNPEDREKITSALTAAGEVNDVEIMVRQKDGNVRNVLFSARFIEIEQERYLLTLAHDITERILANEELRESEENYRSLFQNASIGIFHSLQEGQFLRVNPALAQMMGYVSPEEMISAITNISTQIYVDSKKRSELVATTLENAGWIYAENRYRRKDGTILTANLTVRKVLNPDSTVAYLEGFVEDITERKHAEEQLRQSLEQLRRAVETTIQVLVMAVEVKDPYTAGHQRRATDLARTMAKEMGLPPENIEGLRMAGVIHDIGKITIPTELLSKPTKLSDIELLLIREHVQLGYDILKDVESPWPLAEIVLQHHERMDGSGYPKNLKGDEILMEARILAVADVVEAMASHRPYRPALGLNAALAEIENNKGTLYDAEAVEVCLRLFREKGFQLEGA